MDQLLFILLLLAESVGPNARIFTSHLTMEFSSTRLGRIDPIDSFKKIKVKPTKAIDQHQRDSLTNYPTSSTFKNHSFEELSHQKVGLNFLGTFKLNCRNFQLFF